jgi:hypothetical protein
LEATNGTKDLFLIHKRLSECAAACLEFPMSKGAIAHFGDDKFDHLYDEGIIDYIASAFGVKVGTNFAKSFVWNGYFLGDSIGYGLQKNLKYRFKVNTQFQVSDGTTNYYKDSGILKKNKLLMNNE